MAAILCKSIGDLCTGCGEILCLPCKACGIGCASLCEALSSPFLPYIVATFGLNLAPFLLTFKAFSYLNGDCAGAAQWMIASGGFALLHMIACIYIIQKIRQDKLDEQEDQGDRTAADNKVNEQAEAGTFNYQNMLGPEKDSPRESWGRVKHILCYDKGVALYIVLAVIWIFWQAAGLAKYFNHDDEACPDLGKSMLASLFCGWFYVSLVGFTFLCSMCCMKL